MAKGKAWSQARVRKNAQARDLKRAADGRGKGKMRAGSKHGADRKRALLEKIQERAHEEREAAAHRIGPRGGTTPKIAACHVVKESTRKSMQGNKGKDTKPELLMRRYLQAAGLNGYRLQWKKAPGRPDVAWPGKRTAIFVNGCFWHRCPHCKPPRPKSNVEYWNVKFERNVERDERNLRALREQGWTVHVVWECQLKKKTIDATMSELLPQLARELGKELHCPGLVPPDIPEKQHR